MTPLERVLADHGGDPIAALKHVLAAYLYVCSQASAGHMRATPIEPAPAAKPRVEPLDISREQHPL